MKVKQLDHLNLSVNDFDETVDWYGRVFGFELVEEGVQDGVRWGVIKGGDAMLCIYEHADYDFPGRFDLRDRKLHGLSHFALRIDDRQAWEQTIEREKLELDYGGRVDWPHSDAWYVHDPTGYEIEVARWHQGVPAFAPMHR